MSLKIEKRFMKAAIKAAKDSAKRGDYAIGAVIVKGGKIISVGHETLKSANDPVNGHAEIDAIRKACRKLNKPYLEKCSLYSTHEPCPMCAAASVWAKIDTIVYGVTRSDMIKYMKKMAKLKNKKFSWRQIAISCADILKQGSPRVRLAPKFLRRECLKLLNLTS